MIDATAPAGLRTIDCTGCQGAKQAPIAVLVRVGAEISHAVSGALAIAKDAEKYGAPEAAQLRREALLQYADDKPRVVSFTLCEECARDFANVVGFFCVREGGWSKLEPRKRVKMKP